MKRNPFDVAEKWLKRIGIGLYFLIFGGGLIALMIGMPISLLAAGRPWYEAFSAWIALIGFAILVAVLVLVGDVVVDAWRKGSRNWERKHR